MHTYYYKEYSYHLNRDMEFKVYGHAGLPMVVFPCQDGKFFDFESRGMIETVRDHLENGRLQLFCVGCVDEETWSAKGGDHHGRIMWHEQWFNYVCNEFMPRLYEIRQHLNPSDCFIKPILTGASMGGYATWQLAMSMPECFAAAVPICGGGMYWNAERLKNVPIWAFHGGKDNVVSVEESKKMVDSVNQKGGSAKLTIYPENGHDAWSDTYSNHLVYSWFLSHLNCNTEKITDIYDDSKTFG